MSGNRFCELVGCSVPLQAAAMSRVVTPELVAAVSEAGGLGMVAVSRLTAAALQRQIDGVRALTAKPFGVGFIHPFLDPDNLLLAAEQVGVVEVFYGWPDESLVPAGAIVGWQVGTVDEARAAVDAGCRYVTAQGVEAGGHVRGTVPLLDLVAQVRLALPDDVAVLAAGGLGAAADVKAAFAAGADAVRIGTRLLAADECDIHDRYLDALVAAGPDDAVYTGVFDVGWPDAPMRVLRGAIDAALAPGPDPVGHLGSTPLPRRGTTPPNRATTGQIEAMAMYAGRSVGAVTGRRSAAEIVAELMSGVMP